MFQNTTKLSVLHRLVEPSTDSRLLTRTALTGHSWIAQRTAGLSPKCLMLQTAQTAAQGGKRPFATSVNRAILPSKSGPQSNRIIG